ncbi:MAG TPA: nuclear transport factor 2 family protein [Acidimicrobiales bacterium]|nr:nuclear transport factor 2 family protein [Acidimicrobiales bacterium]
MPTPEQVRDAVDAYVDTLNRDDKDSWLKVFAENARQEDPVGTPVNVGHEAIAQFWDNFHVIAERAELTPKDVVVCGAEAAMPFTLTVHTAGGAVQTDGVDLFTVDDDGLVCAIRAFLDLSRMRPVDQA